MAILKRLGLALGLKRYLNKEEKDFFLSSIGRVPGFKVAEDITTVEETNRFLQCFHLSDEDDNPAALLTKQSGARQDALRKHAKKMQEGHQFSIMEDQPSTKKDLRQILGLVPLYLSLGIYFPCAFFLLMKKECCGWEFPLLQTIQVLVCLSFVGFAIFNFVESEEQRFIVEYSSHILMWTFAGGSYVWIGVQTWQCAAFDKFAASPLSNCCQAIFDILANFAWCFFGFVGEIKLGYGLDEIEVENESLADFLESHNVTGPPKVTLTMNAPSYTAVWQTLIFGSMIPIRLLFIPWLKPQLLLSPNTLINRYSMKIESQNNNNNNIENIVENTVI